MQKWVNTESQVDMRGIRADKQGYDAAPACILSVVRAHVRAKGWHGRVNPSVCPEVHAYHLFPFKGFVKSKGPAHMHEKRWLAYLDTALQ